MTELTAHMRALRDRGEKLASLNAVLAAATLLRNQPGPNERALKAWMAQHMPETHAELLPMRRADVCARLNALTGANVRSCDTIEDGSKRFLAALRDMTGEP